MINSMSPITPLTALAPISALKGLDGAAERPQAEAPLGGFEQIFRSAVDAVKEADAEKTQLQYLDATGQLDNPAQLMLAGSKYEMSVSLLTQLRNRALEAYNELMRISL